MTTRRLRFESATELGYLALRPLRETDRSAWWQLCKEQRVPFVAVNLGTRYASLDYSHASMRGTPAMRRLTPTTMARLDTLLRDAVTESNRSHAQRGHQPVAEIRAMRHYDAEVMGLDPDDAQRLATDLVKIFRAETSYYDADGNDPLAPTNVVSLEAHRRRRARNIGAATN